MEGMIDVHCHIIPGVDDGPSTKSEVRSLLKRQYESGVRAIVLTPHYRKGMFEADKELVIKRAKYVVKEVMNLGLDMKIFLGCEYHANTDLIEDLLREKRFRINGGRYVLLEFSHRHYFDKVRNWVLQAIQAGFKPIIAHPERFPQVDMILEQVEELSHLGALIQIDSGALLGKQGFRLKRIAKKMLKAGYVDLIGTDAHDMDRRCPDLDACAKYVTKKMGEEYARKILIENPKKILRDREKVGENE